LQQSRLFTTLTLAIGRAAPANSTRSHLSAPEPSLRVWQKVSSSPSTHFQAEKLESWLLMVAALATSALPSAANASTSARLMTSTLAEVAGCVMKIVGAGPEIFRCKHPPVAAR
jgi:hypothetical protein